MADHVKDEYKDTKTAKASLNVRLGWITRTSKDVKAAISAFQTKNTDRNAAKLESLEDGIDTKIDNIHGCGDWINTYGGIGEDEQKTMSQKITVAAEMAAAAKKDIMECLKDHTYAPGAASARAESDRRQIRPITDLKPEKLHVDDSPGKLRIWEESFLSYFTASNVDVGDMATQQNFLRATLDPDLVVLLKQRIDDTTGVH